MLYRLGDAVVFLAIASWAYRAAWRAWDRRQLRKARDRWDVIEAAARDQDHPRSSNPSGPVGRSIEQGRRWRQQYRR